MENMLKYYFCIEPSLRLKQPIILMTNTTQHPATTPTMDNIPTIISQLPQEQRELLQQLKITHINEKQLHKLILDKDIYLASDGSVTNITGT